MRVRHITYSMFIKGYRTACPAQIKLVFLYRVRYGTPGCCITFFLLIYGGSGAVVVDVAETRFDTGENNERDASLVREC